MPNEMEVTSDDESLFFTRQSGIQAFACDSFLFGLVKSNTLMYMVDHRLNDLLTLLAAI